MTKYSPELPTNAIEVDHTLNANTETWFEYRVKNLSISYRLCWNSMAWKLVFTWLEEARIEYFRSIGINYADLVNLGCEMPVVDISIRYHHVIRMDDNEVIVKTRMKMNGVRLNWDYQVVSVDNQKLYISAQVTLVGIDSEQGKIMRQLPSTVTDAIIRHKDNI